MSSPTPASDIPARIRHFCRRSDDSLLLFPIAVLFHMRLRSRDTQHKRLESQSAGGKVDQRQSWRHSPLERLCIELRMSAAKATVGLALFIFSGSTALGDVLLEGAIYCDSADTLSQMVSLARAGDNQGLAKLISSGHVEPNAAKDIPVKVLARGEQPDSPLEFAFPSSPTNYWTLSRWVTAVPEEALSSPSPAPSSTPIPASPNTATRTSRREATPPPFDDQGGQIVWHQVDGKWKWRPRDPAHFKGIQPRLPEN